MTGYMAVRKGENSVQSFILAYGELCREGKAHV